MADAAIATRTASTRSHPGYGSISRDRRWALRWSYFFLVLFAIFFLLPPLYMLITSLKTSAEISAATNPWWVYNPTLDNYSRVLASLPIPTFFQNSIVASVTTTVLNVIVASHLSFSLQAFRASTQGTSGASSASSSSSESAGHTHVIPMFTTTVNFEAIGHNTVLAGRLEAATPIDLTVPANYPTSTHSHPIPHTHSLTAPDGLYDTGMAQGVHVFIDGTPAAHHGDRRHIVGPSGAAKDKVVLNLAHTRQGPGHLSHPDIGRVVLGMFTDRKQAEIRAPRVRDEVNPILTEALPQQSTDLEHIGKYLAHV